jgi:hypothetical protein
MCLLTGGDLGGTGKSVRGGPKRALYLVDDKCNVQYAEEIFEELRCSAQEIVWTETMSILKP